MKRMSTAHAGKTARAMYSEVYGGKLLPFLTVFVFFMLIQATPLHATACWAAWSSSTAYVGGSDVSYNGVNYTADYWTEGNIPSSNSGAVGTGEPWIPEGSCSGSGSGGGATPTPTASGGGSGCSATSITPYIQVNGGSWAEESSATVSAGASVNLGPQPVTGGSWSWSGPNGYSSTSRQIGITINSTSTYTATYTNSCGATSTETFTLTVSGSSGGCTPTSITPYIQVNGGSWAEESSATVSSGASVNLGPQPVTGGSWNWSGPNGYSSTSRQIGITVNSTSTYTATYTNASGCASSQSFTLSVSSSGGGGGGGGGSLPAHVLMGYWQDFTNGATNLTIADVPTTYNIIAVAFGSSTTTPGQVAFSIDSGLSSSLGGYSSSQFIADIGTAHSRGQKVILSVGGADGTVSVSDSTSASNFASSVSSLMSQYGFDGVDIDLESGINPSEMAAAISQLKSMQPNALVTAAPQTVDTQSSGDDYFEFASDIGSSMTMMNTQYYNSGSMNGCDGNVYSESTENFITALACTQLEGLSANTIGVGLPASTSAAGSGYVSPSVVVDAIQCLASGSNCGSFKPPSTWPGLRGVMTWSINWDASNGYNFANTVAPALSSLP